MSQNAVGNQDKGYTLTENDWSDLETASPYEKSKHLAERSAWEFVKNLPGIWLISSIKTYYDMQLIPFVHERDKKAIKGINPGGNGLAYVSMQDSSIFGYL